MLTMSCTGYQPVSWAVCRSRRSTRWRAAEPVSLPSVSVPPERCTAPRACADRISVSARAWRCTAAGTQASFHVVSDPILGHRDRRLRGVPTINAIILAGAEVVLLAPFDRPAAQALGVDLYALHRSADFCGVGRPARGFEHGFEHQSADPAFRELLGRISHISLFRFVDDLLVDGQVVLEQ